MYGIKHYLVPIVVCIAIHVHTVIFIFMTFHLYRFRQKMLSFHRTKKINLIHSLLLNIHILFASLMHILLVHHVYFVLSVTSVSVASIVVVATAAVGTFG